MTLKYAPYTPFSFKPRLLGRELFSFQNNLLPSLPRFQFSPPFLSSFFLWEVEPKVKFNLDQIPIGHGISPLAYSTLEPRQLRQRTPLFYPSILAYQGEEDDQQ